MPRSRLHTSRRGLASCTALLLAGGMAGVLSSPASAAVSGPSAPLRLTASQTAGGQVTLGWRTPATDGGRPITGYDAFWSTGQAGNGMHVGASTRTAVFKHLDKGTYTFSVVALNARGSSPRANVRVTISAPRR